MSKPIRETNREEVFQQLKKELNKTQADLDNDVKIIKEWLKTQPHLPETPEDAIIEIFILWNKFSIEKTKQKLDMYYSIRGIVPEFFNKHPCSPEMVRQAKISMIVPLPKLTPDQRIIYYIKFSEGFSADEYDQDKYLAHVYNIVEVAMREDIYLGAYYIIDCVGFKLSYVTKVNPIAMKKNSVVMEKVFSSRVTSIYFINFHSYMESLFTFVKGIFPEKIRNRLIICSDPAELLKKFPKRILPKDIGGDEKSLDELAELWQNKFESNKELFDKLTTIRVDESKRPASLINDEILGFHGNFKKLDVD